ncbi:hypothetical protein R1sor_015529 [Riccia sorocarpa]|uniref:Kinesin motor domain-containing protein n=1 Tax=Riccia sorocarpa TaxID=122646 RepID=A0ABD3HCH6_9MARC
MAQQSLDSDAGSGAMNVEELIQMLEAALEKEFTGMKKTCEGLEANSGHSQTVRINDDLRSSSSSAATPDSMYSACSANGSIFSRCSYVDERTVIGYVEQYESLLNRVRAKLEATSFEQRVDSSQLDEVSKDAPQSSITRDDCSSVSINESGNEAISGSFQNTVLETTEAAPYSKDETCSPEVQRGMNDHSVFSDESNIKQNHASVLPKIVPCLLECGPKDLSDHSEKNLIKDLAADEEMKGSDLVTEVRSPGLDQTSELSTAFDSSVYGVEGAVFTIGDVSDEFVDHEVRRECIRSTRSDFADVSNVANDKVRRGLADGYDHDSGVRGDQKCLLSTPVGEEGPAGSCGPKPSEYQKACASDKEIRGALNIYEGELLKMTVEDSPLQVKLWKVNTGTGESASGIEPQEEPTYDQLRSDHLVVRTQNETLAPDVANRVLDGTVDETTDPEVLDRPIMAGVEKYCEDQNISAREVFSTGPNEDLSEVSDHGTIERSITADEYFQVYWSDARSKHGRSTSGVLCKEFEESLVEATNDTNVEGFKQTYECCPEYCQGKKSLAQVSGTVLDEELNEGTDEVFGAIERPVTAEEYFRDYGQKTASGRDILTFGDSDDALLEQDLMDTTSTTVAERSITADEYFQIYGHSTRPQQDEPQTDELSVKLEDMPVKSTACGVVERTITADEYFQLYDPKDRRTTSRCAESTDHGVLHRLVTAQEYHQDETVPQNASDLSLTKKQKNRYTRSPELKVTKCGHMSGSVSVNEVASRLDEVEEASNWVSEYHAVLQECGFTDIKEDRCVESDHKETTASEPVIDEEDSLFSSATFAKLEKLAAACGDSGRTSNQIANWNSEVESRLSSESTHSSPWVTSFDRLLRYGRSLKNSRRNSSLKGVSRMLRENPGLSKLVHESGERSSIRSTTPALLGCPIQKVKVVVRMRPFAEHEKTCSMKQILCLVAEDTVLVKENISSLCKQSCNRNKDEGISEFRVDKVVDDSYVLKHQWNKMAESQKRMYELIGLPCLECTLDGYNTTIVSYGQAGSGKTYTMMGDDTDEGRGIMPRLAEELMNQINTEFGDEFSVKVSYLEIYQQRIRDLLAPPKVDPENTRAEWQSRPDSRCGSRNGERRWRDSLDEHLYDETVDDDTASYLSFGTCTTTRRAPSVCFDYPPAKNFKDSLKVREHPVKGPYVEGLEWKDVYSWDDMEQIISEGSSRRTQGPSRSNKFSSRGHTVFSIRLYKAWSPEQGEMGSNMRVINLVDLAGPEKLNLSKKVSVERLDESRYINRSIAHLNDMILNLSRNSKFVSYRNSALTKLLRDSLGGNHKTFLIAHLSPAELDFAESVNTLRYAAEASHIQCTVAAYPRKKRGFMMSGRKSAKPQDESAKILAGKAYGDAIVETGSRLPVFSSFKLSPNYCDLDV